LFRVEGGSVTLAKQTVRKTKALGTPLDFLFFRRGRELLFTLINRESVSEGI